MAWRRRMFFFVFSSRRRHTRCLSDWSSDVCSSDLNAGLKYICKQVHLRVETADSPFTSEMAKGDVLQMPIGHMEGNYFCTPEELRELEAEDRIAFRYATPAGEITAEANPNEIGRASCRERV